MTAVKKLWRGVFNFERSPQILYAAAYTNRQAWAIMCRRIANRDGVNVGAVMNFFDGTKDNFTVEMEDTK